MPNIIKHGKEGIDFRRVELMIEPPNYNKNTEARVVTPQFGGTDHLRPTNFPGYILANTNPVDMANQKSKIMHNFNYKCNQMEAKLSPKIKATFSFPMKLFPITKACAKPLGSC